MVAYLKYALVIINFEQKLKFFVQRNKHPNLSPILAIIFNLYKVFSQVIPKNAPITP